MTDINSAGQEAPLFWRRRVLMLPLAIGGLCLAAFSSGAEVLLALTLAPFQTADFEIWRGVYLLLAKIAWHIGVITIGVIAARAVVRRIEGKGSGILSDQSLFEAMFNDQSLLIWMLFVIMACELGGWAAFALLDLEKTPTFFWFLAVMLNFVALRLVGLAIKQKDPTLWPQIRTRATDKATWPGPRKLALLMSLAVLTLFVSILPKLV